MGIGRLKVRIQKWVIGSSDTSGHGGPTGILANLKSTSIESDDDYVDYGEDGAAMGAGFMD